MEEKLNELMSKMDGLVAKSAGTLKEEMTTLVGEVKTANKDNAEVVKGLESRISDMEIKAEKAAKEINKTNNTLSLKEAISKAVSDNAEEIAKVGAKKGHVTEFEIKAAGTISSGNISGGDIPQAHRIAGLNTIPSRRVRLFELMAQASTTSDKIEWTYQANKDGAAGQTGEGLTKNPIDFDWVVNSEDVVKTTAFIKVTEEMLAKGSIVSQEINNELVRELSKAVESGAYNGDGIGINLNGVYTQASPFVAGTAGSTAIENANEVDVLATAMTQIRIAQEGDANPNAIMMHPTDVLKLKLSKLSATDKRYLGRLMEAGQSLSVDGVTIVETTLVTEGEYLIGDFSYATFWQREGMRVEVGFDTDDFTKNLRTIRAELRGAVVVKDNDTTAFVKGVFDTDILALEALV